MSNKTAFGKVIGCCDNCRALLYEHSKRYWVKFQHDAYCFCRNCVTVIEPGKEDDDGRMGTDA